MSEQLPGATPPPSVIVPVSEALDWTGRVLFKPFDAGKWFVLGFCAWLANLGQGGGGGNSYRGLDEDTGEIFGGVADWIHDNWAVFLAVLAVVLVLALAMGLLLLWLSSRGKFMFLDGVVHDRGAVKEPWHRFRDAGWSLFLFRLVLSLVGLGNLLVFGMLAFGLLWGFKFEYREFQTADWWTVALLVLVFLAVGIVFALVMMATNDFVVPLMWVRGASVTEAWAELRSIAAGHAGSFVGYVLMKIGIALATGLIACVVTVLTCCVAAIPYLGTVILLPLFVFDRSYSIHFLSRLRPDLEALAPVRRVPAAPADAAPPEAPA